MLDTTLTRPSSIDGVPSQRSSEIQELDLCDEAEPGPRSEGCTSGSATIRSRGHACQPKQLKHANPSQNQSSKRRHRLFTSIPIQLTSDLNCANSAALVDFSAQLRAPSPPRHPPPVAHHKRRKGQARYVSTHN